MPGQINKAGVRVVLLTPWSRIEGTHYVVPGVRMSDSVNSETAVRTRYLPLTDAVVAEPGSGAVLFRSRLLMVSHAHIVCMTPTSEVQTEPSPAEVAALSSGQAAALAADMQSLLSA